MYPKNGGGSCSNGPPILRGGTCDYICNPGYMLLGGTTKQHQTCDISGTEARLSGSGSVTCQIINCPAPKVPDNGNQLYCSNNYDYNSVCVFTCIGGYGLPNGGKSTTRCTATGSWSVTVTNCVDIQPPQIQGCPQDVSVTAPLNQPSATVTWTEPTATDNAGPVTAVRTQGQAPGSEFNVSTGTSYYTVIYTATDATGNKAAPCIFRIRVEANYQCPDPPINQYTSVSYCTNNNVSGSLCVLSCSNGFNIPVGSSNYIQCQASGTWPATIPQCKDTTPPIINECPSSLTVNSVKNMNYANVTWTPPTAMDYVDGTVNVSIVTGSSPGSLFYITGSPHQISYTAVDAAGNTAFKCTFYVTVQALVQCSPSPVLPANAIIDFCTEGVKYKSYCIFKCQNGFKMTDIDVTYVTCQQNGNWSSTMTKCTDAVPPSISGCPQSFMAYTGKSVHYLIANWTQPNATDNIDGPVPLKVSGPSIGDKLYPIYSPYTVKITAADAAGNQAAPCAFQIIVAERACSALSIRPKLTTICTDTSLIYGTVCSFTCQSGYKLNGNNTTTCELLPGDYTNANWTTPVPTCGVATCNALDSPQNGAMACSGWNYGLICTMSCMNPFTIPATYDSMNFIGTFVCDDTKGTWTPSISVPNCTVKKGVYGMVLPSKLFFNSYNGSCSNATTLQRIKENFINTLKASAYSTYCTSADDDCSVENVNVKCGTTVVKRSPSDFGDIFKFRVKRATTILEVRFDLKISVPYSVSNQSGDQQFQHMYGLLNDWLEAISVAIDKGTMNLNVGGQSLQPDGNTLEQVDDFTLQCEPGNIPNLALFACIPCPAGTFFNTDSCYSCPIGQYQPLDGQVQCSSCPSGYSTRTKGAQKLAQCIAQCPTGHYSTDGVTPCLPCPVSKYQDLTGQTECHQCLDGLTTATLATNTSLDCRPVDLSACKGDPCNGQTCVTLNGTFLCYCHYGYSGQTCNIAPKPCDHNGCLNNATCQDNGSTNYTCVCDNSHFGNICQFPKVPKPCDNDPCNGQVCVNDNNQYTCYCSNGSTGQHCETAPDPCSNNACTNEATCVANDSAYYCMCPNGYTGILCENKVSSPPCSSAQCNGHQCVPTQSNFTCVCFNGWTGTHCETAPGPCYINSCLNGATCVEVGNTYTCTCAQNYTGQYCQSLKPTSPCSPNPCNGFTCLSLNRAYQCVCDSGWSGSNCTIANNPCYPNPCQNNGACSIVNGTFKCTCNSNYCGEVCVQLIVHGMWTLWADWSSCDQDCGYGNMNRTRYCIPPGPCGNNCTGPHLQVMNCTGNKCPVNLTVACPDPVMPLGSVLVCNTSDTMRACNVTCKPGRERENEMYTNIQCGLLTNYTWTNEIDANQTRLPSCTLAEIPPQINVTQVFQVQSTSCDDTSKKQAVQSIDNRLETSGVTCASSMCSQTVTASCTSAVSSKRKRSADHIRSKRDVNITAIIISIVQSITADPTWSQQNASDAALWQNLIGQLTVIGYGLNNLLVSGNLTVEVGGKNVTVTQSDIMSQTHHLICPTGTMATWSGLCVNCPPGTYSTPLACVACPLGTYQVDEGQSSCNNCSVGYTTTEVGARDENSCKLVSEATNDQNSSSGINLNAIAVGVSLGTFVLVIIILIVLIKKYHVGRPNRTHSEISIRSVSSPPPYKFERFLTRDDILLKEIPE